MALGLFVQVVDLMINEMELLIKPKPGDRDQYKKGHYEKPEEEPVIGIEERHRNDFLSPQIFNPDQVNCK